MLDEQEPLAVAVKVPLVTVFLTRSQIVSEAQARLATVSVYHGTNVMS